MNLHAWQKISNENFGANCVLSSWETDPVLTVSQWSDRHRILSPRASSEPGKYRTSRTPYMREIMDCLSVMDPCREVVFMKAAQVGATEAGNNWIGYIIDHAPGPTLLVQPTVDLARKNSRQRIDPLIEESPRLKAKVSARKARQTSNTMLVKDFPGGTLVMTGANSAVGLRSMPARFLFLDEVDAYPRDADGEGDPIDLARARTRTFYKKKIFIVSTPTIHNASHIERHFEKSDKRYFHVPCPVCGHMQPLLFKQLKFERDEKKNLVNESVHYECESKGCRIENWQKTEMLQKGEWIATSESEVPGFHLNALYSPVGWFSWLEIIQEFLEKKRSPEQFKTFVNTVLGETWKEKSERPDWRRLYERRESWKIGTVPEGVLFMTCGVDVQKNRLEAEVVGWGRDKVSWSVDYRVMHGDTSDTKVWQELEKLLDESFPVEKNDKIRLGIKMMGVDSGYNTQNVYDWCRKFSSARVIPLKGRDSLGMVFSRPQTVDVSSRGKTIRRGLRVWTFGTNLCKTELYGWLRQPAPVSDETDPPGFCHFPEYDDSHFKQLTAEEMVTKFVKGFKRFEWHKIRERNEALDCRIMSRVIASICGIDRVSGDGWERLRDNGAQAASAQSSNDFPRRRRSKWL